jgi:hypothetical protein
MEDFLQEPEAKPEVTCPSCRAIWWGMLLLAAAMMVGMAISKQIGSLPVPQIVEAKP